MSTNSPVLFAASIVGLVPAAAATDIFQIASSVGKTIRLLGINISGLAGSATTVTASLIARSTLDTGGTSTVPVAVPLVPILGTASALLTAYTANPTLGTLVGPIASRALVLGASGAGSLSTNFNFPYGAIQSGWPIVGAAALCLSLNGATITTGSLAIDVVWTE